MSFSMSFFVSFSSVPSMFFLLSMSSVPVVAESPYSPRRAEILNHVDESLNHRVGVRIMVLMLWAAPCITVM